VFTRRILPALGIVLAVCASLAPLGARAATVVGDNARTLIVSVPGPFNGCSVLDRGATATTGAVLDLTRPSAFETTPTGTLVGEGGAIASAELTSLSPTIAAHQLWSNDLTFNGADLVSWWQRARSLPSVMSDGYRDIQSLSVGSDGLSVTAVFANPYADWNLLFRDVEARGTTPGCAVSNLLRRPSLGPYKVVSASSRRVTLVMNPRWKQDPSRFGHVILITSGSIPAGASTPFANYSLAVSRPVLETLSSHPSVASRLGSSSNIEVMSFAPNRPLTRSLNMRKALSWSIDRQALINRLWGSITFSPSVAASAIISQGQSAYPGTQGTVPTTTTSITSTTTPEENGLADCLTCAYAELTDMGYHRSGHHWLNAANHRLTLRVITGPSGVDQSTTTAVVRQWAAAGIAATVVHDASDVSAAEASATNYADVAIFAKPTSTTPSVAARSWSGPAFADSYLSGFRSTPVTTLFDNAISNFNSAAATTTWLQLDQLVLHDFWVRPLFTAPSIVEWSNLLDGVTPSLSVAGFVDQLTGWNTAAPASG
jgi:ABC-type transport system substrate-binding protein